MITRKAEATGPAQQPEILHRSADSCDFTVEATVSIVMVTFHTGPVVLEAIKAVLSQDGLCELILVDNGNSLEALAEIERCAAKDDRITVHSGLGNIGYAAACNFGAKRARAEYLHFLNPDCILPPNSLRNFLAEGNRLPRPWMLGGRIVNPDGSEQRGSRREILTPWTAFVEAFRVDRLALKHPYFKRLNQHTTLMPRDTTPVPVISGACIVVPAADYWAIGGMDEDYFLHVDDIDLCHRFRKAGGEVYFVPHVEVLHFHGTSAASPLFIEWHKARGFIRYFQKNFSGVYPPLFLLLANAGILLRFALKASLLLCGGFFSKLTNKRSKRTLS